MNDQFFSIIPSCFLISIFIQIKTHTHTHQTYGKCSVSWVSSYTFHNSHSSLTHLKASLEQKCPAIWLRVETLLERSRYAFHPREGIFVWRTGCWWPHILCQLIPLTNPGSCQGHWTVRTSALLDLRASSGFAWVTMWHFKHFLSKIYFFC